MTIGLWMEVPPVFVTDAESQGSPYCSMVFDSQNVGHATYDTSPDGTNYTVEYRTLTEGEWSDPVEFLSDTDGGSTAFASISIDQYDNLYASYYDYHDGPFVLQYDPLGDVLPGGSAV